jgi:outer membrane lipoprotein-sorting protein
MRYVLTFLLLALAKPSLALFAQTPAEKPASPAPASKDGVPPAAPKADPNAPAGKAAPVNPGQPAGNAAPGQPQAPPAEPETPADKIVKEAAKKLEKVKWVSAKIHMKSQTDQTPLILTGTYRRGPDYRIRVELETKRGEAFGRKVQVCDGKTVFWDESVLESRTIRLLELRSILDEIEKKVIPAETYEQIIKSIGIQMVPDPTLMLNGYLAQVTFTNSAVGPSFGGRKTTVVEGHWRKAVIARITNNPGATSIEQLGAYPQYVRLVIDDVTGFPLRFEIYLRTNTVEYKPIVEIEFQEPAFPESLPDAEFAYRSKLPTNVPTADVTQQMLATLRAGLQQFPNKAGATVTGSTAGGKIDIPGMTPAKADKAAPNPEKKADTVPDAKKG